MIKNKWYHKIFNCMGGVKHGWFRIFGYGIRWKHESIDLVFSERNGYTKLYKISKYYFNFLGK